MAKPTASDQLRLGKTTIVLHEVLNQLFHIGNVVVWPKLDWQPTERCQSAFKFDPGSASNFDPLERRVLAVALAPSELVGVAETARAQVGA